jgi:hypothetical protein
MSSIFPKLIYILLEWTYQFLKVSFVHFQLFHYLPGWGWGVGGEKLKINLDSAQLELDLGLSLAKTRSISMVSKPFLFEVFVAK